MKTNVYRLSLVKEKAVDYRVRDFRVMNPNKVAEFMNLVFNAKDLPEEHLWTICCDSQMHVVGVFEVSHGTVDSASASPKDILKRVLVSGANGFIVVHNHPSGSCYPSDDDNTITRRLYELGRLLDLRLLDHVIIGDGVNYSYKEEGKIE